MFSENAFTCFKIGHYAVKAAVVTLAMLFLASSILGDATKVAKGKDHAVPTPSPKLVVDLAQKRLIVKLAGVVMREYHFENPDWDVPGPTSEEQPATDSITKDIISGVYLLAAAETIPDLELSVIMEETGLPRGKVQRYAPRDLVLTTEQGVRISIHTDCANAQSYLFEKVKDLARRTWSALLGRESIEITMSANDALSLWGVARTGMDLTIIR